METAKAGRESRQHAWHPCLMRSSQVVLAPAWLTSGTSFAVPNLSNQACPGNRYP